jgi:hypothetical protein
LALASPEITTGHCLTIFVWHRSRPKVPPAIVSTSSSDTCPAQRYHRSLFQTIRLAVFVSPTLCIRKARHTIDLHGVVVVVVLLLSILLLKLLLLLVFLLLLLLFLLCVVVGVPAHGDVVVVVDDHGDVAGAI